jgi:hypothetical protein
MIAIKETLHCEFKQNGTLVHQQRWDKVATKSITTAIIFEIIWNGIILSNVKRNNME